MPSNEEKQLVLDQLAVGRLERREFLAMVGAATAASLFGPSLDQALAAGANQEERRASLQTHYDFIVVGAGAAGSVLAAELSASGAQVLVIESGGPDTALPPARQAFAATEQPQLPHGPGPRSGWRHQHQRHGVDPRHATGLRQMGEERRQGLGLR